MEPAGSAERFEVGDGLAGGWWASGRWEGGFCRTMIGVAEGRALGHCGGKIRGWMCG